MKKSTTFIYDMHRFRTILTVLFATAIFSVEASHFLGGEITYTHINGTTYLLQLNYYYDCQGVSANTLSVNITGPSAYTNTITLNQTGSPVDGIELCPSTLSSNVCNGGSAFNYRKQRYEAQITLPSATGVYTFTYNECCRSGTITNLQNPSANGVRLQSWLNFVNGHHDSPTFPQSPLLLLKSNISVSMAWNATDNSIANHEDYTYGLTNATNDAGAVIPFNIGYSPSQPFGGSFTQLNTSTGLLTASPNAVGNFVVCMEAYVPFWGGVKRDFTIKVANLSNQIPDITGYNGDVVTDTLVAVGTPLQLSIQSNDNDPAQASLLSYGGEIPSATFNNSGTPHQSGVISFTPTVADTFYFSLRVTDDNCPYYGIQDKVYRIISQPVLQANAGTDVVICLGQATTLGDNPTAVGGVGPVTYSWSPAAGLSATNIPNPVASPLNSTTYSLIVTDSLGNIDSAQVTVTVSPPINLTLIPNNVLCNGGSTGSICANVSGGVSPYAYLWSNASLTSCINNISSGVYSVTIVDANGCTASAQTIISQPAPLSVSIQNNGDGIAPDTLVAVANGGVAAYVYIWSNTTTSSSLIVNNFGSYTVTVTDMNGCTATGGYIFGGTVNVTYPNGGENLIAGQQATITWTSQGNVSGNVKIEAYSSIAFNWVTLTANAANTGNYSFAVPNLPGTQGKIRISDAANAAIIDESDGLFNIVAASSLQIDSFYTEDVSCYGLGDGTVTVFASGGNAPYTYSIDIFGTFQTSNVFNNLPLGSYVVSVKDANNTQINTSATVMAPDELLFDFYNSTPDTIIDTVAIYITGGVPPYTINWGDGATSQSLGGDSLTHVYGNDTVYLIHVTDNNGCSYSRMVDVGCDSISSDFTVPQAIYLGIPATFNSISNSSLDYYYTSHVWNPGDNSINPNQNLVHTYLWSGQWVVCHYVQTTIGCLSTTCKTISVSDTCSSSLCVWPGDANYDGLVDNNDLLPIGLGFGTNGIARLQQDINWYAHVSDDWTDTLADGTNYKHSDCNGSGVINSDDTLAILQNFALTHPRSGQPEPRGNVPALRIQMVPDTLADGETVLAHLLLGDTNFNATNVYALAFTFNFDPLVVDSNEYGITFSNNSWLCSNPGDHVDIDKKLFSPGQIKTALTRIDQTTRSGAGEIGTVSMKITTGNINGKDLSYYSMQTYISDLVVIDNDGNFLTVDAGADSAQVEFEPTGVSVIESISPGFYVIPNPATDFVTLIGSEMTIESVEVVNQFGEAVTVIIQKLANNKAMINVSNLASGVYYIYVKSSSVKGVQRFLKLK